MRFKTVEDPKSTRLVIRVTPEEKRDIADRAAACNMSVSGFVLRAAQGRQTRTKHDLLVVNELRELGLALKAIYQAEQPRTAEELEPVMRTIVESIERIALESRISL